MPAWYGYYRIERIHCHPRHGKKDGFDSDMDDKFSDFAALGFSGPAADILFDNVDTHPKAGQTSVGYHDRKRLAELLGDLSSLKIDRPRAIKPRMGLRDTLVVYRLGHLSAELSVIGQIVRHMRSNELRLVVVSQRLDSGDPSHKIFFDALETFVGQEGMRKDFNGGGDGGGDGGC